MVSTVLPFLQHTVVKTSMEFNEKLQQLRKRKGLTQGELAELLYVSRTAVSKWESGRGFPNIDSLKAISAFFSVSLDELLSGEELLTIAETDSRRKEETVRDLVFGLLDCGMALLFFLPFFGAQTNGVLQEVPLLQLSGTQPYTKAAYLVFVPASILVGILTLALQNCRKHFWVRSKYTISLLLSAVCVCLFIVTRQPYAAVFTFVFLRIKAFLRMKQP